MFEKSSILLAGAGVRENSTVASGSNPIKLIFLITGNIVSTEKSGNLFENHKLHLFPFVLLQSH